MDQFEEKERPVYDLFDGLSRRRRMRRLGIDPDAPLMTVQDQALRSAHESDQRTHEPA
jgi:hypothetical protein